MPNIDQGAKAWELELSGRVGTAVLRRRKALGLTAVQLADKTRDLGYPIEVLLIYQAAYAAATSNAFTPDGNDGHFAWCIAQLLRADISQALGL